MQFLALQKVSATHEATIQSLHRTLDAKEAQQEKLKLEAVCGSTIQKDVDALMLRAAALEQDLAKVRYKRREKEDEDSEGPPVETDRDRSSSSCLVGLAGRMKGIDTTGGGATVARGGDGQRRKGVHQSVAKKSLRLTLFVANRSRLVI